METYYRIELEYAVFAVIVSENLVVRTAAPIAKWTIGRKWSSVEEHYKKAGAKITKL